MSPLPGFNRVAKEIKEPEPKGDNDEEIRRQLLTSEFSPFNSLNSEFSPFNSSNSEFSPFNSLHS